MKFRNLKIRKSHRKYFVYLLLLLVLLLIFSFFNKQVVSIIFTIMLIVLGSMSSVFKRITGINLGIEFITFTTVLFFYSFGITFGLMACAVMLLISTLSMGRISPENFTGYMMYCVIAIISLFLDFGISANGMILVLFMNLLGALILILLGLDIIKNSLYLIGNTIFNIILFKYFSEIIFSIL